MKKIIFFVYIIIQLISCSTLPPPPTPPPPDKIVCINVTSGEESNVYRRPHALPITIYLLSDKHKIENKIEIAKKDKIIIDDLMACSYNGNEEVLDCETATQELNDTQAIKLRYNSSANYILIAGSFCKRDKKKCIKIIPINKFKQYYSSDPCVVLVDVNVGKYEFEIIEEEKDEMSW